MNVFDAAASLPNGLHDAILKSCTVDFASGTAVFHLDAWVGDLDAPTDHERERYQPVTLRLTGLIYFHLEPGQKWYLLPVVPSRIDLCEADAADCPEIQGMHEYFKARLFLEDRNAFLRFAAREAAIIGD